MMVPEKDYTTLRQGVTIKEYDKTESFLISLINILEDIKKDLQVENVPSESSFKSYYMIISNGIWDPALEIYGQLDFTIIRKEGGCFFNQKKFISPVLILKSNDLRFSDYKYCISFEDNMDFENNRTNECSITVYGVYNHSSKIKRFFKKLIGKD